jgi:plasmid stabilization system protein ParE
MAKRVVVWTETAMRQRREILRYWTIRNGSTRYAKKLIQLTKERIEFILENPEAFKLSTYPETRESAMGNFSIYYKIFDQRLIVTAFWDNRQDPKELLEILTK